MRRRRAPIARAAARSLLGLLAVALLVASLLPATATAHSLQSSTVAIQIREDSVVATVDIALATLDDALGAEGYDAARAIAYVEEHLAVTGADGRAWDETSASAARESIEGVDSVRVEVLLDPEGSATDRFTVAYDAVIETIAGHRAVVVLVDSAGDVSTPGVLTGDDTTVEIVDGSATVAVGDMVGLGFSHVLEGADHLLFLLVLLLPAPLVAVAGRWRRGGGPVWTLRRILHVVTAFTLGHSLTLTAAALGWVSVASRPVEVLIAASVAVAAVHAIRPLTPRGEVAIAASFGLVHGLAFAGILADLGLAGRTSVIALLAFNVGVELAQLVAVALVLPSVHLVSRTSAAPALRIAGASLALLAAALWALDRVGLLADPLAGAEEVAIAHPWPIVAGLAALAGAAWLADRSPRYAGIRSSVRRTWFPEGSRKEESIPYGRSSGRSTNSTPRADSSS